MLETLIALLLMLWLLGLLGPQLTSHIPNSGNQIHLVLLIVVLLVLVRVMS